jgi:hypothetical protein
LGEPPDRGGYIRTRGQPRHDFLDLRFRLPAGRLEQNLVVGNGQVRSETPDGRQVHRALGEHAEDDREPSSGPGDLDPVVGLPFGQPEHVPAIQVQRRVAFPQVYISRVQLREVRDDLGRGLALSANERLDLRDEGGIGKACELGEDIVLHVQS